MNTFRGAGAQSPDLTEPRTLPAFVATSQRPLSWLKVKS
jgi:hypothetical protein